MRKVLLILMLLSATLASAQEKKYSCSMKVENPKTESQKSETQSKSGRGANVETTTRTMHVNVKVSVRGKEMPTGIRLNALFTGRKDGQMIVLGKKTVEVKVDEKGDFKTELVSDPAVWTEKKTRAGRGRNRNTKSEGSGTRLGGCIVQLVVGDKVERVYTSKPAWAKLAKQYPLPESEILKLH